ncbi:MAG: MerR family transcriptional regulator [Clostridia bacterium]|nr:MerR family transcriptional regulator [Clostridia bacterium]
MMKIGEFARICNASVQTIRYYDAEGVLPADSIDQESGYRYYSIDSVAKYRTIVFYKELGFSLDEIKRILSVSEVEKRELLLKKRAELIASREQVGFAVASIDRLISAPNVGFSKLLKTPQIPFTDHPEALGKWELCGSLASPLDMTSLTVSSAVREASKVIYLLPEGAPAWQYFWTKGTIYRLSGRYPFAIPNEYRLMYIDGVRHMLIRFVTSGCIEHGEDPVYLLYVRNDDRIYTEGDIRAHTDDVDIPFYDDRTIHGEWRCVDFVPRVDDFSPNEKYTPTEHLFVAYVRFVPRGLCIRGIRGRNGIKEMHLRFTKGMVINDRNKTAEAYLQKEIAGIRYLFVQHKSGDYVYGGRDPYWYVFTDK